MPFLGIKKIAEKNKKTNKQARACLMPKNQNSTISRLKPFKFSRCLFSIK